MGRWNLMVVRVGEVEVRNLRLGVGEEVLEVELRRCLAEAREEQAVGRSRKAGEVLA